MVLVRHPHLAAELARRVPRPRGVAQELAAQQDRVRLAVGQDLLGLLRIGDAAARQSSRPGA
ncbi:hypothetical protein ADK65_04595 [Streptomyces sp. NRRL B-1140]|nr:hypothetical protein ADK65_04595 [Streptomyces sp. NRRL B-1140]